MRNIDHHFDTCEIEITYNEFVMLIMGKELSPTIKAEGELIHEWANDNEDLLEGVGDHRDQFEWAKTYLEAHHSFTDESGYELPYEQPAYRYLAE